MGIRGRVFDKNRKPTNTENSKFVCLFSVTKHVKKIQRCSVKLVRSSEPYCVVASSATSSSLHKSTKQGTHVFSAGFLSFKPLKQPNICNKKRSAADSKESNTQNTLGFGQPNYPIFPPPLQDCNTKTKSTASLSPTITSTPSTPPSATPSTAPVSTHSWKE